MQRTVSISNIAEDPTQIVYALMVMNLLNPAAPKTWGVLNQILLPQGGPQRQRQLLPTQRDSSLKNLMAAVRHGGSETVNSKHSVSTKESPIPDTGLMNVFMIMVMTQERVKTLDYYEPS